MELTNVYNQLGILFTLMLFGYILGKLKILTRDAVGYFTSFIVKVAMPAMIINGMLIPLSAEKLKQGAMAAVISIGVYIGTYGLAIVLPKLFTKDNSTQSVYSFAIMFSNVGFMGYPVLSALFGEEAIFVASIYNISFNILVYTIGIKFAKGNKGEKEKINLKVIINPGTVASLIGLILFLTAPPMPEFLTGSVAAIGGLSTPMSMIAIGAMLSELPIGEMFNQLSVYLISFIRLIILPGLVLIILKYILKLDDPLLVGIAVVVAGMPVASNAAMMIRQYEGDSQLASKLILVSTLFSGITIPILAQML